MAVDVSVVVPFFNPTANLDDCVASVVAQTLPADRYELVLVDDGSTDGSGARADDLAARHPDLIVVHHLPASGGPARPRNFGIDHAAGRYIQFLDSDDTLAPRALERQLEVADDSDAEVVVGKLASDFRGVWHPLFRRTVTGRTLADYPLEQNLTVCKMFRRDFLLRHGVRFPEGPHYIEDQQICVQAYAHARSVAVVADTVCYFYRRRRTGGLNHGDTQIVPGRYFDELEALLDVIESDVAPEAQPKILTRYYRAEVLGRLRGQAMASYSPEYREEMLRAVRRVATERFPEEIHDRLPAFVRAQSRLVRDGKLAELVSYSRRLEDVRLTATASRVRWVDGRLELDLDAYMRIAHEPLRLEHDGDHWALPESFAPGVPVADRRFDQLDRVDVDLATIARADAQLWSTTDGLTMAIDDAGVPRIRCRAAIDPTAVMGGSPLAPGLWDLRLRVMVEGMTRTSAVRRPAGAATRPSGWVPGHGDTAGPPSVRVQAEERSRALVLDVDEWTHSIGELVDNPRHSPPSVDGGHTLVLTARRLRGPDGAHRDADLVLTPVDAPDLAPIRCPATFSLGPSGSTLRARIPRLPQATTWKVWLTTSAVGAGRPRRLPLRLSAARFGRIQLTVTKRRRQAG
jgi:glycosyltransferase involved in cell wall biosynthesis